MKGTTKVGLVLVVLGVSVFAVGLVANMDVIPKFSQWEGVPLDLLGVVLVLAGITIIAMTAIEPKVAEAVSKGAVMGAKA